MYQKAEAKKRREKEPDGKILHFAAPALQVDG